MVVLFSRGLSSISGLFLVIFASFGISTAQTSPPPPVNTTMGQMACGGLDLLKEPSTGGFTYLPHGQVRMTQFPTINGETPRLIYWQESSSTGNINDRCQDLWIREGNDLSSGFFGSLGGTTDRLYKFDTSVLNSPSNCLRFTDVAIHNEWMAIGVENGKWYPGSTQNYPLVSGIYLIRLGAGGQVLNSQLIQQGLGNGAQSKFTDIRIDHEPDTQNPAASSSGPILSWIRTFQNLLNNGHWSDGLFYCRIGACDSTSAATTPQKAWVYDNNYWRFALKGWVSDREQSQWIGQGTGALPPRSRAFVGTWKQHNWIQSGPNPSIIDGGIYTEHVGVSSAVNKWLDEFNDATPPATGLDTRMEVPLDSYKDYLFFTAPNAKTRFQYQVRLNVGFVDSPPTNVFGPYYYTHPYNHPISATSLYGEDRNFMLSKHSGLGVNPLLPPGWNTRLYAFEDFDGLATDYISPANSDYDSRMPSGQVKIGAIVDDLSGSANAHARLFEPDTLANALMRTNNGNPVIPPGYFTYLHAISKNILIISARPDPNFTPQSPNYWQHIELFMSPEARTDQGPGSLSFVVYCMLN